MEIMLIIKIMNNIRQQINFYRNSDLLGCLSFFVQHRAGKLYFQGGQTRFAAIICGINVHFYSPVMKPCLL